MSRFVRKIALECRVDTKTTAIKIRALTEPYQSVPGGLLPALWNIQNTLGYVPEEHVPLIAETMNLSIAEVHGVISFYHDFRSKPVKHSVKICRAEACQAMGARSLAAVATNMIGTDFDKHSADDQEGIELRSVYCLGLCANAPSAMIDGELYAGLDEAGLTALLDSKVLNAAVAEK